MKKLAAIVMVFVYVTSVTELHQFFKLPVLWQHYLEHQQKDKDITFLQYLSHHYDTTDVRDDDYDRDMQLPFKDLGHCSFSPIVTLTSYKIDFEVKHILFEKIYPCYYKKFVTAFHLKEIWQPPRV